VGAISVQEAERTWTLSSEVFVLYAEPEKRDLLRDDKLQRDGTLAKAAGGSDASASPGLKKEQCSSNLDGMA